MAEQNSEELVVDLQKKLAEALEANGRVVNELAAEKQLSAKLIEENELLYANNKALSKKAAELEAEITEATKGVAVKEKVQFEHDGKKYEVLVAKAKLLHEGEMVEMTAADIAATPEAAASLVKSGSGLIKEIK